MVGDICAANMSRDAATPVSSDHRPVRDPLSFGRIVVIGGGCYGSWYTRQLSRAIARGALVADEIVVVDHNAACTVAGQLTQGDFGSAPVELAIANWADYVATWLSRGVDALQRDAMVPSPLMPHLCLDWLLQRAAFRWPTRQVTVEPLPAPPPTPWQRAAPDGRHYVSFATWMCPVNCIEPAKCPETKSIRDWSLPPTLKKFVADQPGGMDPPIIFHCTHRTYGVGMIDAAQIAAADKQLSVSANEFPLRVLVGTVSHCHGALGVLTVT
jgi:hypothetical protein